MLYHSSSSRLSSFSISMNLVFSNSFVICSTSDLLPSFFSFDSLSDFLFLFANSDAISFRFMISLRVLDIASCLFLSFGLIRTF
eukprot:UN13265